MGATDAMIISTGAPIFILFSAFLGGLAVLIGFSGYANLGYVGDNEYEHMGLTYLGNKIYNELRFYLISLATLLLLTISKCWFSYFSKYFICRYVDIAFIIIYLVGFFYLFPRILFKLVRYAESASEIIRDGDRRKIEKLSKICKAIESCYDRRRSAIRII